MQLPKLSTQIDPAEPLRKRAPAVDEDGRPLSDFMMIIPGLKKQPQHIIQKTAQQLQVILNTFESVVFADLNLNLNLLWVTIRPEHQLRLAIATEVQRFIPDAKLVSHI